MAGLFGDLSGFLGDVGRGLFAQTLPGQAYYGIQAAKQRQHELADFTRTLQPQSAPTALGSNIAPGGQALPGGMSAPVVDMAGPSQYSATQIALAREAYARGHPEQAATILQGPADYTLNTGDERHSGRDQSVVAQGPLPSGFANASGASIPYYHGKPLGGILPPGMEQQPDGYFRANPPPPRPNMQDKVIESPPGSGHWIPNPALIDYEQQAAGVRDASHAAHRAPRLGRGGGAAPTTNGGWEPF